MALSPGDRGAAEKLFDEIARVVLLEFADAEIVAYLGDESAPAELKITLGAGHAEPIVRKERPAPRRHSHPFIGRRGDVLVHTHTYGVAEGHEHRLSHLGPMVKATERAAEDLDLAGAGA